MAYYMTKIADCLLHKILKKKSPTGAYNILKQLQGQHMHTSFIGFLDLFDIAYKSVRNPSITYIKNSLMHQFLSTAYMSKTCICLLIIIQLSHNLYSQKNIGYCQDFESFNTCTNSCNATCNLLDGWSNETGDGGNWIVDQGGTSSSQTGPSVDKIPGTSVGKYIYLETSSPCYPNVTSNMLSPELDLAGSNAPLVEFYYHMFGSSMGTLHIDVSRDNGVTFDNDIDMISGNHGDIWLFRTIDLTSYIGDTVRVRFRGVSTNSFTSDMAIDFFCLKDLLQLDAGITAIDTPSVPNCAFGDDIYVTIENFGTNVLTSATINWEVNNVAQSAYNWTGSLARGEKDSLVKIGMNIFQEFDTLKTFTSLPNGMNEITTGRFNDTTTTIVKTGLSGTYTIGVTGDYTNFTSAVNALDEFGICGPVVFMVEPGIYTEQIILKEVINANATNSITFVSATGEQADVILTYASFQSNENYTVKIEGGDYFRFEYMTIENTGTTYGRVLDFLDKATNNTFTNCHIKSSNTTTTSTNMAVIWSSTDLDDFNTFSNNIIEGGSYGTYWYGAGTLSNQLEQGTVFDNNLFLNQYYRGTHLYYQDAPSFTNNTFESNTTYTGSIYRFYFLYCDNGLTITGNQAKGDFYGYGIYIGNCDATPVNNGLIANNFIQVGDPASTNTSYGIYLTNSGYQRIVHNNVNLESNGTSSRAIYLTSGGANEVLNNNFVNTGPGYAYYLNSQYSVTQMDHNNLYAPNGNVGFFVTDHTTLEDFQTASGLNANGLSVDPQYFMPDDLHVCEPALHEAGTPLAYITDDWDKEARAPVPDIGADEFFSISDFRLGPDQLICPGDTLAFHAGSVGYSVVWSTGEMTQSVRFTAPGTYWVEVNGPCGMVKDTVGLIASALMTFYKDQDGDGLGDPNNSMTVCQQPMGYLTNMNDCDDSDDGIGVAPSWYKDMDNDGYSDGTSQSQCLRPNNHKLASELLSMTTDCNDMNGNIYPGANELCNGMDDDCDMQIDENLTVITWYKDMDMDGFGDDMVTKDSCDQPLGYVQNNKDCDDSSVMITITKTWYKDFDNDGYTDSLSLQECIRPPSYKLGTELIGAAKDCDDLNSQIHPGATEICNGKDDNCDGNIDEGLPVITWYYDFDGDGYGVSSTTKDSCAAPLNYSALTGDCNDLNDEIHPGASDNCNGIDDDCDLQIDEDAPVLVWFIDNDMDGFGDDMITKDSCDAPIGYTDVGGDCDDNQNTIYPDALEVCNGLDDDCDGNIDEGLLVFTWYTDADGDGFGDATMSMDSCAQPVGYVNNNDDCDDTDNLVTLSKTWYKDFDNDGYTDSMTVNQCMRPPFYKLGTELVGVNKDCNDLNPDIYPGATEICNGLDDNCDGNIDEGLGPLVLLDPDFIYGDRIVCPSIGTYEYYINPVIDATNYEWTYSGNVTSIVVTENVVTLEFDNSSTAGLLSVSASGICASTSPVSLYLIIGLASQCNYSECEFIEIHVDDELLQSTGVLDFKSQKYIFSPAQLNQGLQYKFQAGSSIELTPGFEVSNLAIFDLNIGPCQD